MLKKFTQQLERTKLLKPGRSYVVAVSGGRDSVVLLDLLSRLQEEWGWDLIVAHLDHAQREASADDARFVGTLADRYGHRYMLGILPPEQRSETDMRQARHEWLENIRHESGADKVLTAHHADDRLETALWHAMRGADRHGLTSLGAQRGLIVRPLIGFGRGDIVTYAASRGLEWREDVTNEDRSYTRNLIRHELLHYAPTRDPHYRHNLTSWLDHLDGLNTRIDRKLDLLVREIAAEIDGGFAIARVKFLRLNPIVQMNVLAYLARRVTGGIGLTEQNLAAAHNWFMRARSGSFSLALPGLLLVREYDTVKFVSRSARPEGAIDAGGTISLDIGEPIRVGRFELTLQPSRIQSDAPDTSLIPDSYFVRTWQPGDRMQPVGMSGSKKLQDLFTDRKIPRTERLTWPIVVSARNEIAVVPNLARDRRYSAKTRDQTAHKLEVKVV